MRQLKDGTCTIYGLRSMGGPASLTISAGEWISEALYQTLPPADRKRFKKVAPTVTSADPTDTPDTGDTAD